MKPAALLLAVVLLTGCAGSGDDLRDDVAALTEAANDGDADRVRLLAEQLAGDAEARAAAGDLDAQKAERLVALARSVQRSADVIDADLLEQRRREAELEAERKRLEEEKARLEAEREAAEEQAKRDAEQGEKGEGKGGDDEDEGGKGKGKSDD